MLGRLTGVPTLVGGVPWIAITLGVTWLLFRRAWRSA
jgi:hypothetical protein